MDAMVKSRLRCIASPSVRRPLDTQIEERSLDARIAELESDIALLAKAIEAVAVTLDRDRRFDRCGHSSSEDCS